MGGGLLSQAVLQEHSPEAAAPEVPAPAFRVVCDSMLGGLGRTLRCLGVNVRVLHSGEHHRQAAQVSGPGAPPVAGLVCSCLGLRSAGSCGGGPGARRSEDVAGERSLVGRRDAVPSPHSSLCALRSYLHHGF